MRHVIYLYILIFESIIPPFAGRKRAVRDDGAVIIKETSMDVVDPSTKAKFVCEASPLVEETLDKIYSTLTTVVKDIIPGDLKLIIDFLEMVSLAVNSTVITIDEHLLKVEFQFSILLKAIYMGVFICVRALNYSIIMYDGLKSKLMTNYRNPVCAFLDFSAEESGVWSSEGCHVLYYDQDYVTCECSHTTNFAVLMSPYIDQHTDNYIINTISIICVSVSIICLLATVLVYAVLWRYVKSDRAVLYVNLSVTLTFGYVVFLAGINQTQNKVMCTVIAAVLHFLFLVVFFSMLGQGLNVLLSVISGPLLIVVITIAVTKAHGYTTDTYCWLSIESGVFWSFSVPALSIILLNFIIVFVVLKVMQTSHFMSNKPLVARTKSVVRSICILSPILGLSWVFGVLSMTDPHVIFQYLFALTNSLQGLLIFICQCLLQQQVRDGARAFIRRYRADKLDSGHTTGQML
ncbi:adhesion G-protein coupled receptor D1-like [Physella acuta]|uniref:adhesion G-protein coupled receptor D1-like n=1 Tax=Physella acuta TaxID=109671 RepID=UPI0027DC8EEC|nr:adhesion G-protein coupled receptor D1-like [Physella acuta]